MLLLVAKTICERTQLTMSCSDPEGGWTPSAKKFDDKQKNEGKKRQSFFLSVGPGLLSPPPPTKILRSAHDSTLSTGWKLKVHVIPSVDLYSERIIVKNMYGKFQIVYSM